MKHLISLMLAVLLLAVAAPQAEAQPYNYAEVLQKSMLFYEAQQSGPLTNNRLNWRGNSAMNDGSDVGHDLTGGWYDAGDHVKFGFPMAFSATMLAWGGIEFENGYTSSGQMQYLKNNLRFVNDYFIKCHTAPNEFWGQVGNGGVDHSWWGSAEVMQMQRPAYKIDASSPGSELAAETAAALAAASIIFASDDPTYSATLVAHAEQLYSFADSYRDTYVNAITDAASFYNSFSGYNDELVWGAIWLYKATGNQAYLDKAELYYDNLGNEGQSGNKAYKWALAWDDKGIGCYALLAQLTGKTQYKEDIERHLDYWTDGYNGERITYTPGGLAYLDVWGVIRYAMNTSFVALAYHEEATTSTKSAKYYDFAVDQMTYALGDNPRNSSYVCGFGTNPPVNPHHRTAHGCWSNNQNGPPASTRHVLYGALVGGPNNDDSYTDDRSNYINNEVATDYNAGFSGVVAKMVEDFGGSPLSNFPIPEVPTDEYIIEAKINGSGNTYTEWAVWAYNHTAWPARIPSMLSFRLFVDISEGLAAGYSPTDYVVSANGASVSFTSLQAWDAANDIYYTEATFVPSVILWPGGNSESREEAQIRIRLPYEAPASAWNAANDWSSQGLTSTLALAPNIPYYVDGVLAFGIAPGPVQEIPVTGVSLAPATKEVEEGDSFAFSESIIPANATNKNVTWSSSDVSIATVDASGVVTGVSVGQATITVTTVEGDYTASSTLTVSEEVIVPTYTVSATSSGNGSVTLSPAGGVYEDGTSLTLTANPNSGYAFLNWTGDVNSTDNPLNVLVTDDLVVVANFEEQIIVDPCDNPQVVSLPFSFDGEGEFCWEVTEDIDFINSWNMDLIEVNGVDYTNVWSNSFPDKLNGSYFFHYVGMFPWSHLEIKPASGARVAGSTASFEASTLLYPNPAQSKIYLQGLNEPGSIVINDLSGKTVLAKKIANPDDSYCSLEGISKGTYVVRYLLESGKLHFSEVLRVE